MGSAVSTTHRRRSSVANLLSRMADMASAAMDTAAADNGDVTAEDTMMMNAGGETGAAEATGGGLLEPLLPPSPSPNNNDPAPNDDDENQTASPGASPTGSRTPNRFRATWNRIRRRLSSSSDNDDSAPAQPYDISLTSAHAYLGDVDEIGQRTVLLAGDTCVLPIYPLADIVLFPYETLPLRISDPAFLEVIRKLLEEDHSSRTGAAVGGGHATASPYAVPAGARTPSASSTPRRDISALRYPKTFGVVFMDVRHYREYRQRLRQQGREIEDDQNAGMPLAAVGTTAEITAVRWEDQGRVAFIVTRGRQRFRLLNVRLSSRTGVPYGQVQMLDDGIPPSLPRGAFDQVWRHWGKPYARHLLERFGPPPSQSQSQSQHQQSSETFQGKQAPSSSSSSSSPTSSIGSPMSPRRRQHHRSSSSSSSYWYRHAAACSVWPHWVWRQYDAQALAQRVAQKVTQVTQRSGLDLQQCMGGSSSSSSSSISPKEGKDDDSETKAGDTMHSTNTAMATDTTTAGGGSMVNRAGAGVAEGRVTVWDAVQLSYRVATDLVMDDRTRQHLLDMPSCVQRLRLELTLLERADILRCRACRCRIARKSDALNMSTEGIVGVFVNEHGFVHQTMTLRTVRRRGLSLVGRPTAENSWFPGYAWTIANCARCMQHMGWRFSAVRSGLAPREFWGIRRANLVDGANLDQGGGEEGKQADDVEEDSDDDDDDEDGGGGDVRRARRAGRVLWRIRAMRRGLRRAMSRLEEAVTGTTAAGGVNSDEDEDEYDHGDGGGYEYAYSNGSSSSGEDDVAMGGTGGMVAIEADELEQDEMYEHYVEQTNLPAN